ncbi:MAG TPA: response regulator transcription factor [Pyrinomonadaceae bacterium]|nr:response regulator transcription factor [Pyrinomonadaceae bacterium]
MDNQANLLIIGDSCLLNDALRETIALHTGMRTIATATPEALLKTCSPRGFDIVLICDLPGGIPLVDLIRNVRSLFPESKLIALNVEQTDLLEVIEAGAQGYVFKDQAFTEVVKTIESVQRNQFRCSSQIAESVFNRVAVLSRMRDDNNGKLSPREMEILESIAAGLSNKDISQQLGITPCTVKNHVHNILTKLQVRRRQDAIRYAPRRERAAASLSR